MKPSILLVGNFLSSKGGNCTIAEELARQLESAGYGIVTTSVIRMRLLRLLDMLLITFMRRADYQVAYVEVYSDAAFLWAEAVCKLLQILRKPFILTLHGGNLPVFARCWSNRVKRLLQSAGAVTAPSRYLQEEMRHYREDVYLLPNPLDINNYPFRLRSISNLRLVWLRAFHNIYHPQMAPLVIANLRESFPDITLTMIGPDKEDGSMQETRATIENLGLQKNIDIVPGTPKSKVPEYLGSAYIFINTTNIDNTPVSVLEAMACGLCIVSTNVGGLPALLDNEIDALLVPPNDPQSMSSAVRRILTNQKLAETLSKNARKKAERFDWSTVLPQWEFLFEEILKKNE